MSAEKAISEISKGLGVVSGAVELVNTLLRHVAREDYEGAVKTAEEMIRLQRWEKKQKAKKVKATAAKKAAALKA